jgi:DNA repair protein RadC
METYLTKNEAKPQSIHKDHRKRMRKRFLENGLDSFYEHEILEFLLFYVQPRGDTNPTAHRLIREFGSLREVLDADFEALLHVEGVGERSAILLKILPQLLERYQTSTPMKRRVFMRTAEERCDYFRGMLEGETAEVVKIACLTEQLRMKECFKLMSGTPGQVEVDKQTLVRKILLSQCSTVVLAHNHPSGLPYASYEDVQSTISIARCLKELNINLLDHIIVADKTAVSMLYTGSYHPL